MARRQGRNRRSFAALLLLATGVLASLPMAEQTVVGAVRSGPFPSITEPVFRAERRHGALTVAGRTVSREHEDAVRAVVRRARGTADLAPGVVLPAHWQTGTLLLLAAVDALDAGTGSMTPTAIVLRGVTTMPARFRARLDALRAGLPAGVALTDETVRLEATESLEALCARTFAGIAAGPIEFRLASARLRPTAHAQLDRLAEFAFDCRGQRIRITGHTDATGDDAWNLALSRQRAEAVADYLVGRGVPADRLVVAGQGSTMPVADNGTELGRRQNRRIAFDLE